MYYCEFPNEVNYFYTASWQRTVGRYVIINDVNIPVVIATRAVTIVRSLPSGYFYWFKRPQQTVPKVLTNDDEQQLMVQVLKSEVW